MHNIFPNIEELHIMGEFDFMRYQYYANREKCTKLKKVVIDCSKEENSSADLDDLITHEFDEVPNVEMIFKLDNSDSYLQVLHENI